VAGVYASGHQVISTVAWSACASWALRPRRGRCFNCSGGDRVCSSRAVAKSKGHEGHGAAAQQRVKGHTNTLFMGSAGSSSTVQDPRRSRRRREPDRREAGSRALASR